MSNHTRISLSWCGQMGAKAGWDSIARSNVTMTIGKFLLFAREFDMLPHIVTKQVRVERDEWIMWSAGCGSDLPGSESQSRELG